MKSKKSLFERTLVAPSDSIHVVIAKLREEASWQPENGKTWRLLTRAADELEQLHSEVHDQLQRLRALGSQDEEDAE